MNARALRLALAAVGVASVASSVGCSHGRSGGPLLGGGAPVAETRDELLIATGDAVWRGDLATAHAMLTRLADRERAVADTALDFWSEMLALLRCEPLKRIPRTGPHDRELSDPWDGLRRLAQIERVRLGRDGRAPLASAGGGHLKMGMNDNQMVWPVEKELWTDELPMPAMANHCAPAAAPTGDELVRMAMPASEPEVALVSSAAGLLPAEHPAKPLLFVQAAVLDIGRGDPRAAGAPLARLEELGAPQLTPDERERILLAAALASVADPSEKPDALLAKGRAALALKISAPARRALSLLLAERLLAAGRMEEASATLGPPPHGEDAIGRYIAFRQMEGHARAARLGPLLAEAREVLARRSYTEVETDPTLTAIMDIALRTLLASPVSDETMEVIESLGPPRERLARAEAFAQLALETGAFKSAMVTFVWLNENEKDASRQLQDLARASVAAARAGDRAEFARTFRLLAGQEERLEPSDKKGDRRGDKKGDRKGKGDRNGEKRGDGGETAVASHKPESASEKLERQALGGGLIASAESDKVREKRRAARSVNWQRALLVVARDALPALVENDDQANLATLVDTLKRHLGDGNHGAGDEELTTLYRAASAHLKTGARAYAETIGAERRPILLGDVLIGRRYNVPPPRVDLSSALDEVGPLVFVPRRGNDASTASIMRWPGRLGEAWTGSRS